MYWKRRASLKKARSLIVWLDLRLVGNELVVALDGEVEGGSDYAETCEGENGPAGGAERPRDVEMPAVPEAGVVVEEEGLELLVCDFAEQMCC